MVEHSEFAGEAQTKSIPKVPFLSWKIRPALRYSLAALFGIPFASCVLVTVLAFIQLYFSRVTLQTLASPDGKHRAELRRIVFIDRNYAVQVDGATVFHSPDFSIRRDLAFRETLLWDTTGTTVILEIGGQRLFGYDAVRKQPLTDEQLLKLELPPPPELWEYGLEGEWPGIGRVQKPRAPNSSPRD